MASNTFAFQILNSVLNNKDLNIAGIIAFEPYNLNTNNYLSTCLYYDFKRIFKQLFLKHEQS